MRLAGWLRLAALCVIAGSVSASGSPASAQTRVRVPTGPKTPVISEEFKGYGLTPKDAESDALRNACDWLAEHSGLGWKPTPDFLREKGMIDFDKPVEEEFKVAKDFAEGGKMKVVKMRLTVTAEQAREIQKQARQERMQSRQWLALLGLGGMVCLIAVVGGYLRLEEATKGYYTRRLRLAAIGIVLLVLLALMSAIA